MDVLVLPTHREGFPNTVSEAQAAEIPVVTTNATGAVDRISPDVSGIASPWATSRRSGGGADRRCYSIERARGRWECWSRARMAGVPSEIVWKALVDLYCEMLRERGLPVLRRGTCRRRRQHAATPLSAYFKRVFDLLVATVRADGTVAVAACHYGLAIRLTMGAPGILSPGSPGLSRTTVHGGQVSNHEGRWLSRCRHEPGC